MKFWVLNRNEIKNYKTNLKHIVISIADSTSKYPTLPNNKYRMGLYYLIFDDIDRRIGNYILFNELHASSILRFVNCYKNTIDLIICQCEAGISRSAGVAGALSKILNRDDNYFFKHYHPNKHIYNTILKIAEEKGLLKESK